MTEKALVIDPPSGWKYGFPKILPQEIVGSKNLSKWLIENGYPEDDVKLALKHSRYWETTV